jgi:hypothetical protein
MSIGLRKPCQLPAPAVQHHCFGAAPRTVSVVPWPSGEMMRAVSVSVDNSVFSALEAKTLVDWISRQFFARE